MNTKRTPLYDRHVELGGKMVEFAGWELPVQYSGVVAEHQAVRERAGLFDVSHMGEVLVEGAEAEAALQYLTCNDVSSLVDGKAQYSALTNDKGGVVDDIIIYRMSPVKFFVCVNAANTDKDFAWMTSKNKTGAKFTNVSAEYGQIALQGPRAAGILSRLKGCERCDAIKYFHFRETKVEGVPCIVARTGYTGEDGFEIFVPWKDTRKIWDLLLDAGKTDELLPCGLGARDSLRLEACYPLHGHELGDDITAIESGLGWIVKPNKPDFIGKKVLSDQKVSGSPRSLVGFFVDEPGIARHGDRVLAHDFRPIGTVTSGTKTPSVQQALGLAIVESDYSGIGSGIIVEVRGRRLKAHVVKRPFYVRKG